MPLTLPLVLLACRLVAQPVIAASRDAVSTAPPTAEQELAWLTAAAPLLARSVPDEAGVDRLASVIAVLREASRIEIAIAPELADGARRDYIHHPGDDVFTELLELADRLGGHLRMSRRDRVVIEPVAIDPAQAWARQEVTVDWDDVPLAQVLDELGRATGERIALAPDITEAPSITLRGKEVPLRTLLRSLAQLSGMFCQRRPDGTIHFSTEPPPPTEEELAEAAMEEAEAVRRQTVEDAIATWWHADADLRLSREIEVQFDEVALEDALGPLRRWSRLDIARSAECVCSGRDGAVTLTMHGTIAEVLRAMAAQLGDVVKYERRRIVFTPAEPATDAQP